MAPFQLFITSFLTKVISKKEAHIQYWSHLLKKITSISSETENIDGVNRVQNVLERKLHELGLTTELIDNPDKNVESGKLLMAHHLPEKKKFITLICHADTVYPLKKNPIVSKENGRIYGSGIIDNKGGIIVGLYATQKLIEKNIQFNDYGIRFICSPNEERGSPGLHTYFKEYAKDSDIILGLEPALDNGDIISSRKGNRWYDISVEGHCAHAGRNHSEGVNACSELAIQIAQMHGLTDYSKDITVNVGKISGGEKHNIVSDKAYAQIDVRFPCFDTRALIGDKITNLLKQTNVTNKLKTKSCRIDYQITDDCPPLAKNKKSQNLFNIYKDIIQEKENISINERAVGGAADANYFSSKDKIVLDGLGPIGSGMHTDDEYIEISSIQTRGDSLFELISQINKGVI